MTTMGRKLEEDDPTDLALMWEEASIQYYNAIEMKPTDLKRFKSVDEILADRDIQNNFQKVFKPPTLYCTSCSDLFK
jgi:hypothetical protein